MPEIEAIKKEYEEILQKLSDPGLISDWKKLEVITKKKIFLEKIITKQEELRETKSKIEGKMNSVQIPIKAILGQTKFTVGELLDLQIGDVLQLNTDLNSNIEVMVGELHKFDAKPGVKKNKVAVKIVEVIRREDD